MQSLFLKKKVSRLEATVILPTHNRMPILKSCLSHLMNQTVNGFEVILIDDCSTDGTYEYIKGTNYPNLHYIPLEKQRGPYYARNIGIKEGKGEIIIFIDSDVIVFPDFIEDHIKIHNRRRDIVLQGMVKHVRSLEGVSTKGFYLPNALCLKTFITQNVSVRRKYLVSVGGFDNFGPEMGYKDVDMGFKLMKLGLKWVYGIRKCKAFHIDSIPSEESLKHTFEKWEKQGSSAYYFVKKWGKSGEKYARTRKAIFFSNFLSTERWVERESTSKMMIQSKKFLGIVWVVLKGITRYHYRKKGIRKAMNNESFGNRS